MFGWFKRKPRAQPEARWVVGIEEALIRVTDPEGVSTTIPKSGLTAILIETNDSGPWGADVWWVLQGEEGSTACAFPMGASGEDAALDYFCALPCFDHEAMIRAMTSTGNAVFPVWRRAGGA